MDDENDIATLVIQHHVKPRAKSDYETWVKTIAAEGQHFKGERHPASRHFELLHDHPSLRLA